MSDSNDLELGKLMAKVDKLEREVEHLQTSIQHLIVLVEQAKGGWKTLLILGAFAGSVGAVLGKLAGWWLNAGPKA